MNAGKLFTEVVDGVSVTVIATSHFVVRYEKDDGARRAVRRHVSEEILVGKIKEALHEIVDLGEIEAEGIIKSKSTKLNMSFAMRPTKSGGLTVTMMNAMVTPDYKQVRPGDYIIHVNPSIEVKFRRGIGVELREVVLSEIVAMHEQFADGSSYRTEGETAEFDVAREGSTLYVDDADWRHDLFEISVS